MKQILLLPILLFGCSENITPPKFDSFSLADNDRFEICFNEPFKKHKIMLALVITNNDGTVIDRKWHDEYQVLYGGTNESEGKCYNSSFLNFMSAANSTPKEMSEVLHNHHNEMINKIGFSVATSENGKYRSKVPNEIYIQGEFFPLTGKVNLSTK